MTSSVSNVEGVPFEAQRAISGFQQTGAKTLENSQRLQTAVECANLNQEWFSNNTDAIKAFLERMNAVNAAIQAYQNAGVSLDRVFCVLPRNAVPREKRTLRSRFTGKVSLPVTEVADRVNAVIQNERTVQALQEAGILPKPVEETKAEKIEVAAEPSRFARFKAHLPSLRTSLGLATLAGVCAAGYYFRDKLPVEAVINFAKKVGGKVVEGATEVWSHAPEQATVVDALTSVHAKVGYGIAGTAIVGLGFAKGVKAYRAKKAAQVAAPAA